MALRLCSWRSPHCSVSANYLPALTPNKSNLSQFTLNRPRLSGVLRMKHCICHTECVSFYALFSSLEDYFTLFEVSFISPTYRLQNWLGLRWKTPTSQRWFNMDIGGKFLLASAIKDVSRLDIISITKASPKENKRKQNVNKPDIWEDI